MYNKRKIYGKMNFKHRLNLSSANVGFKMFLIINQCFINL